MTTTSARWIANNNLPSTEREPLRVLVGGAGRALTATLPRHARFNERSQRFQMELAVHDPAPGKAIAIARQARSLGVVAAPHEQTIQAAIRADPEGTAPLVLHVDNARSMRESFELLRGSKRPVLGALVLKGPTDRILTMFFVRGPGDDVALERVLSLISSIERFQASGTGRSVLGEDARAEHRAVEPMLRAWMASKIHTALPRVVAGLPIESPAIEVTEEGQTSTPLVVHTGRDYSEPRALAESVTANPDWRVRLGEPVTIAEVVDDGLRFHRVRRRVLDRKVSVTNSTSVLSEAERRAEEERARESEALARALSRTEKETVNSLAPIAVTD